jgi:hypothetical protein
MPRAIITGASSGIGAAMARELSCRGYALALLARRAELLDQLASNRDQPWAPSGSDQSTYVFWVTHLDVPAGVIIESRDTFRENLCLNEFPSRLMKVALPVFRSLTLSNRQVEIRDACSTQVLDSRTVTLGHTR